MRERESLLHTSTRLLSFLCFEMHKVELQVIQLFSRKQPRQNPDIAVMLNVWERVPIYLIQERKAASIPDAKKLKMWMLNV